MASTVRKIGADQRVLETTLKLFTQKGFFNTSVQDISRESGVSVGSIYHHFSDKEGIAKAMFAMVVETIHKRLDVIEGQNESAHDRCQAVVRMLFEMADSEPEMMSFMLHAKHQEFLPDERPMCSSEPFERMRSYAVQGMKSGELRVMDPMICAASLYGSTIRMIHLKLDGLIEKPLSECVSDIWRCAWRGVAISPP